MASTYTTNLGIEKIGTGEQSGTWGDTTNTNFDILDEAVNGIISITLSSAGSSGSPTALPITDGASSNGRNKFIEFVDGGDLGGTAYVQLTPNDAEKIVHIRNSLSSSRSVIVFQGTYNASNDFEIVNGADVLLKFNGGGSGATVTDVNVDLTVTGATIATADINGGAIDGTTIGGSSAAVGTFTTANATTVDTTNLEVTNLKAKDGTAAGSIADSSGVVTIASAVLTTADINGGTADNVTIGGSTAAAGTFTTFTSNGIDDNADALAMTISSSEDISIGSASNHAGARVVINDTPPTAFGSPMFQVGQETFTGSGMYSIGFGYTAGSYTEPPVEIAAVTTTDGGGTKADIVFGTRNATTNTAVTERMRIDTSGNVSIGDTTPSSGAGWNRFLKVAGGTSNAVILDGTDSQEAGIGASDGLFIDSLGHTTASNNNIIFRNTSSNSSYTALERVRIDSSGNFLINRTAAPNVSNAFDMGFAPSTGSLYINSASSTGPLILNQTTGDTAERNQIRFFRNESEVGNITSSTSATAYNTSSDVRLKENIIDAPAGNIDDIRVRSFDWKVDGSHQTYGMVAQELVDVAPEAVTQGGSENDMWSVDYSKLVPMLIKEIQDLKADVATLKGS